MNTIAYIPGLNALFGIPYKTPIIMIKQIGVNIIFDAHERAMERTTKEKTTELLFFRDGGATSKPADEQGILSTNVMGKVLRSYVIFKTKDNQYYPINIKNTDKSVDLLPINEDAKARIRNQLKSVYFKYKEESKIKEIAQILWPISILITVIALIVFWSWVFPSAASAGLEAAGKIAEVGTVNCVCPP